MEQPFGAMTSQPSQQQQKTKIRARAWADTHPATRESNPFGASAPIKESRFCFTPTCHNTTLFNWFRLICIFFSLMRERTPHKVTVMKMAREIPTWFRRVRFRPIRMTLYRIEKSPVSGQPEECPTGLVLYRKRSPHLHTLSVFSN